MDCIVENANVKFAEKNIFDLKPGELFYENSNVCIATDIMKYKTAHLQVMSDEYDVICFIYLRTGRANSYSKLKTDTTPGTRVKILHQETLKTRFVIA